MGRRTGTGCKRVQCAFSAVPISRKLRIPERAQIQKNDGTGINGARPVVSVNRHDNFIWLLALLSLGALLLLVGYPACSVLICSLQQDEAWSLANYLQLVQQGNFLHLVLQSVLVSCTSAGGATLLGTIIAIITVKTTAPLRRLFALTAMVPIILPAFITAIAYIFLFGRNGLITYKLLGITWNVYSWKSVCILQVVDQTATAFLMVAPVLSTIGGRLEEAARTLGGSEWYILRTITLKLAWPMISASFLLNFMRAMGDFGTPLIVGGPFDTLASASYTQLIGRYNLPMAATYNMVLLLITVVVYARYVRLESRQAGEELSWRSGSGGTLQLRGPTGALCWLIGLLFVIFIWALVVAVLMAAFTRHIGYDYRLTLASFNAIGQRGLTSTMNTIYFALAVGLCTSVGGQLLAYLTQRVRVPGRKVIDALATLPFALPGTFIGIGYATAFNTPPLLLTGTWFIVVMNLTVRKLPLGLRTGSVLLSRLDVSLDEASALLGAGRVRTFFRVILPHLRVALLACGLYAFVSSVQALGSIIFIITPGTRLLSVDVFEAVVRGDLGIAAAYSVIMMVLGVVGGGGLLLLEQRRKVAMHTLRTAESDKG